MPNAMPLLSKSAPVKSRRMLESTLPSLVSDLGEGELTAHCDRCGRHLRLHPGPADLNPRARLARLLDTLRCSAQRRGSRCDGLPRRLILIREERQWVLEADGDWAEDTGTYWEQADFEPVAAR
jgi:hypothetical protein